MVVPLVKNVLTKAIIRLKSSQAILISEKGLGGDPQEIMKCWNENNPQCVNQVEFIFTWEVLDVATAMAMFFNEGCLDEINISKHFN